ncbi:MAG TPA: aminotransferase class I/II-fold pyridoxal phosphate-dependent enzyme [Stenomitos sp.]
MFQALARYHDLDWTPFHTPGHKYGRGAAAPFASLMGAALQLDLTELDETDNLHAPEGAIAEAQSLAARAFGADETYFLVNGSTVGLHAMIMAACRPGEAIALSRATHLSAMGGILLAGARPVFVGAGYDASWQLPADPTPEELRLAFQDPAVRAVLVTRPDYFGRSADLAALAAVCRDYDRLLLVDEAHGAHLGLDPRLPSPALALGADAVVQSTHKLLSAMTQASMLHLKGDRMDSRHVRKLLRLLQTTSPSFVLLASLDVAREQYEAQGAHLWHETLDLVAEARRRLATHGIRCLGPDHGPQASWDPAKLVVDLDGTGHDGYAVAEALHQRLIQVEIATPRYVGALVSPGNTQEDLERLVTALLSALGEPGEAPPALPVPPAVPELAVLPRDAYFGRSRTVPLRQAEGEVACELVCPYPPGIPALVPGERITAEVLEYLDALRGLGASFVGPEDPSLETIQVCSYPTSIPSSPRAAATSS